MRHLAATAPADGRRARATIAVLAVLAIFALVLPGLSTPAQAADNDGITITDLTLTRVNDKEEPVAGNLLANSSLAVLRFGWDARNTTIKDGDSLSVELPPELRYRVPATKDFLHDLNGDGALDPGTEKVGSCEVTTTKVSCTFNEVLPRFMAGGYKNVFGSVKVQVLSIGVTAAEELPFSINGSKTVKVDLPGEGGIKAPTPASTTYAPLKFVKGAWGMDETTAGPTWGISFSTGVPENNPTASGYLASALSPAMTFDGTTVQEIVINDLLGDGQSYPDLSGFELRMHSSKNWDERDVRLDTGASGATTTKYGEYSIEVTVGAKTDQGTPATIVLRGPFAADTNYQVRYRATPVPTSASGKAVPGFTYANSASVEGTNLSVSATKSFVESFSMDLTMELGYGTFKTTKYVGGDGASQVPAGSTFTVQVDYTLPGGLSAASYPGWQAPGTLSADGKSGTATFQATMGQTTIFTGPKPPVTFPAGTQVTVTELLDSSAAAPTGYEWDPAFTVNGTTGESVTLTIEDQKIVAVDLNNTLQALPNTFAVVKNTEGDEGNADATSYRFDYTCTDGQSGTIQAKGDGVPVEAGTVFPVGTECTVTEAAAGTELDGYSLVLPEAQTVTVGNQNRPTVHAVFTNTYNRTPGSFSVSKVVPQGSDYQPAAGDTVTVEYTCGTDDTKTIEVPMNGAAVTVSDIPAGTTCTVEEQASTATREGYALSSTSYQVDGVDTSSVTIAGKGQTHEVTIANSYTRLTGGFTLSKAVEGDGAGLVPGDASFTFVYQCTDEATGDKGAETEIEVPRGQAVTVDDIATGSCEIWEKADAVDNTTLATGFVVDGQAQEGDRVTVAIAEDSGVEVRAVNTYTLDTGTFNVVKTVAGDNAETHASKTFVFDYTCTKPEGTGNGEPVVGVLEVTGDGTPVESGEDLPVGTTCTISERASSAQVDDYTVDVAEDQTITIADKDTSVPVSVTNTYTRHTGTFSVTKTVSGAAAGDKVFTFSYTCTNDVSGEIEVKADGTAVSGPAVPTGTECTIKENTDTAAISGYTLSAPAEQTVTIEEEDQTVAVTFANAYTANPTARATPDSTAPSSGTPGLARTGATVGLPILVAVAALAGGVLLVRRRRS